MPKTRSMDNVSRPLIALLLGTVALFALWFVAFKPSSSKDGTTTSANYQPAIDAARKAVSSSNAASAAQAAAGVSAVPPTSSPNQLSAAAPSGLATSPATTPSTLKAHVTLPQTARHHRMALRGVTARLLTSADRQHAVAAALRADRPLALLFYNPTGADDRAVRQELAAVPTHGHRVVKLAIPLSELSLYSEVTNQVTVNQSPTLVLIDRAHSASLIVGFSDRFEIAQRVDDALATG